MEKGAHGGSLGSKVWIRASTTSGEDGVKRTHQGGFREPGAAGGWGRKGLQGLGGSWRAGQAAAVVPLPGNGWQQDGLGIQGSDRACSSWGCGPPTALTLGRARSWDSGVGRALREEAPLQWPGARGTGQAALWAG